MKVEPLWINSEENKGYFQRIELDNRIATAEFRILRPNILFENVLSRAGVPRCGDARTNVYSDSLLSPNFLSFRVVFEKHCFLLILNKM